MAVPNGTFFAFPDIKLILFYWIVKEHSRFECSRSRVHQWTARKLPAKKII
jgi:hypothetical protein